MLEKVYNFTKTAKSISSKLDKKSFLLKHKDDEEIKTFLRFLLSPFVVTGLSTKKMTKAKLIKTVPNVAITTLQELMDYLVVNNTGKDMDTVNVNGFIERVKKDKPDEADEYEELIIGIATKKLKLGFTSNTVNEVCGKGTIPSFAVQLAQPYSKHHQKIKGEFFVTIKLDGNRCIAFKEGGVVKFFTRKGKLIDGLVELEEELSTLPEGIVFDGEIILENVNDLASGDLFLETQKVIRKDGDKKGLIFHIFDTLPLSEFYDGESLYSYISRRNYLDTYITDITKNLEHVKIVPVVTRGTDKSIIEPLLAKMLELGYEGLMINTAEGLYVNSRTTGLQKCKAQYDVDLLVTDVVIAIDGKYKGQVGSLIVEYKGNEVGVGSGLNDTLREKWAKNPEEIIGKVIQVQYTEESNDEEGNPSLRFPRFKGVREDKTSDDVNYE